MSGCREFVRFSIVAAVLASAAALNAADASWKMFDRRVGMFIHWGIYAVHGFHEQERMRLRVPRSEYEKAIEGFDAAKFDAEKFVDAAESLGAEYIVITTKHHDGFCLWDTKTTDFNVMNSPAKRDVLKELSEACRRRGMKLGFYYSNPDWHHPNCYNQLSSHQVPPEKTDEPNIEKLKAYEKAQITELLTNYGEICCWFWDIPTRIDDPSMNELVRKLQPGIMIDDRGWGGGDYSTPERGIPEGAAFVKPTEACDSVGARSWGFRVGEDYRTHGYVTRSIDHILSMGGNFLLNVGPKADGTIPAEALGILKRAGDWYRKVRESYRDVTTEPWLVNSDGAMVTRRGREVYLHYPLGIHSRGVWASPIAELPLKATVLNSGDEVKTELAYPPQRVEAVRVKTLHLMDIDADRFANESVVIRLEFAAAPERELFASSDFAAADGAPAAEKTSVRLVMSGADTLRIEFTLENEDSQPMEKNADRRALGKLQEAYGAERMVEFTLGGEEASFHGIAAVDGRIWSKPRYNFEVVREQRGNALVMSVLLPLEAVPRLVGDEGAFLAWFYRRGKQGAYYCAHAKGVSPECAEGGAFVRVAPQKPTSGYYRNPMDWQHGWRACWVKDSPRITYLPKGGAREGGFRMVNTNAAEKVYFHNGRLPNEGADSFVRIPNLAHSVLYSLKVKGRGDFDFGFNPWTPDTRRCLYPSETCHRRYHVDTGAWRTIRCGVRPGPDGVYAFSGGTHLPSLWLEAGGDITVDDLEVRFIADNVEKDESLAVEPMPKGDRTGAVPFCRRTPAMRGGFVAADWENAQAVGNVRLLKDQRMLYLLAETLNADLALNLKGADGAPFALSVSKNDGGFSIPSKRPIWTFVNAAPGSRYLYRIALPLELATGL